VKTSRIFRKQIFKELLTKFTEIVFALGVVFCFHFPFITRDVRSWEFKKQLFLQLKFVSFYIFCAFLISYIVQLSGFPRGIESIEL